jgi:hypothetical protein
MPAPWRKDAHRLSRRGWVGRAVGPPRQLPLRTHWRRTKSLRPRVQLATCTSPWISLHRRLPAKGCCRQRCQGRSRRHVTLADTCTSVSMGPDNIARRTAQNVAQESAGAARRVSPRLVYAAWEAAEASASHRASPQQVRAAFRQAGGIQNLPRQSERGPPRCRPTHPIGWRVSRSSAPSVAPMCRSQKLSCTPSLRSSLSACAGSVETRLSTAFGSSRRPPL